MKTGIDLSALPDHVREEFRTRYTGQNLRIDDAGRLFVGFEKNPVDDILDTEMRAIADANGPGFFRIPTAEEVEFSRLENRNPFAPSTLNLTQQGILLRDRPEWAERLKKAAKR